MPAEAFLVGLFAQGVVLVVLGDEAIHFGDLLICGYIVWTNLHAVVWREQRPAGVGEPWFERAWAGEGVTDRHGGSFGLILRE